MKRVAILLRKSIEGKSEAYFIKKDVIDALKWYDVNYFLMPTNSYSDYENTIEMLKLADGVIIPGGKDEGEIEYEVIKYLYDYDIPTLGICLGMQSMSVLFGGMLTKIQEHNVLNKKYVHSVKLLRNTLLYDIIKKDKILVNSRHSYAVYSTNLLVSATSSDNIIEAVEDASKRCFIGVQWHPESLMDENNKKIFDYFISKL